MAEEQNTQNQQVPPNQGQAAGTAPVSGATASPVQAAPAVQVVQDVPAQAVAAPSPASVAAPAPTPAPAPAPAQTQTGAAAPEPVSANVAAMANPAMQEEIEAKQPAVPGAPAQEVPAIKEEKNAEQSNKNPQSVDQTLEKINRGFKERATIEKARQLNMQYINISVTPINPDLLKLLTPETVKTALIMPFFKIGKKVRIAVADPQNAVTKAALQELINKGYELNINLASDDGILDASKLYESEQYKVKKVMDTRLSEDKIKAYEQEIKQLEDLKNRLPNISSEEAVYLVSVGALKTGASDMHMEPEEKSTRLRFRIDGVLHKIFDIEKGVYTNIVNQIKYQCKMKLNINNEPQDGRYSFTVNERKVDVRVSILPTEFGETIVCRLLDSGRKIVEFEEMGFWGENLQHIEHLTKISHGMILITGPTGSGKTTTLYTMLDKFNKPESKVITLEDPIEYHLAGISQSQINEKRGYDFAGGLRSILRQDPDVVMLGEIRDLQTAETAAQAALTGHVLLSTLHTNSAIESIPRLINIGLPPFMVAPSLNTIIAQRLVRRICPACQKIEAVPKAEFDELTNMVEMIKKIRPSLSDLTVPTELPKAPGGEVCSHTGYKGRVCVVEVVNIDFEMRDLILNKASSTKLIEAARRKGMLTMREDGVLKVLKGLTTLEEVHRVTAIVE
ncbi:MAG: ATPase, T2SS/T4P/T4SS family [Candidatus Gracilibacteria bacterium]